MEKFYAPKEGRKVVKGKGRGFRDCPKGWGVGEARTSEKKQSCCKTGTVKCVELEDEHCMVSLEVDRDV